MNKKIESAIEAAKAAACGSATPLSNWQAVVVKELESNLPKCLADAGLKFPETVKGSFGVRIDGKFSEVNAEIPVDTMILAWGAVKPQTDPNPVIRVALCAQGTGGLWATASIGLGRRGELYPLQKMADSRNPNATRPLTLPKEFVNLLGQMVASAINATSAQAEESADANAAPVNFVPVAI